MKTGRKTIHGHDSRINGRSKEYMAWDRMKRRCANPKVPAFKYYGAKGISVCKEWVDSFAAFYQYAGPCPSADHSLDRFPNKTGNYEPGNIRWATVIEQQNNRTDNVLIESFGQMRPIKEWSEIKGLKATTIRTRLKLGWSTEDALNTPVRKLNNYHRTKSREHNQ